MNAVSSSTRRKFTICLQCRLFSTYTRRPPPRNVRNAPESNRDNGEDVMEPEHDNHSKNKGFNKHKPKFGNIRNFKPAEDEYIEAKRAAVNPKSQFIYGRACVYAALTAKLRRPYQLFVNETLLSQQQQNEEEDTSAPLSPEGFKAFSVQDCVELAKKKQIPIVRHSKNYLNALTDDRPNQGIVLEASEIHYDVITHLESPKQYKKGNKKFPLWVALDQIWDPQNFGSIVRCCYFFGVDGLVMTEHNSPLTPTASRASAGALEVFPVYYQRYLNKFIGESQKVGWHVIGASVSSPSNIPIISAKEMKLDKPTILVLGNESFGLRDKIANMCNTIVNIGGQPESKIVDSLNVGVDKGVLLHSLCNK